MIYFHFSLEDYEPNKDLELLFDFFNHEFQHMSHLSISNIFRMVFLYFCNYFHLEYFMSGFPLLFQLCSHITQGHIPCQITHAFGVVHLLAMTKPLGGVYSIVVREVLYRFISHTLCL